MRDTAGADFEPDARKLHVGHFAFMRAFVQGLNLRDTWDRYLAVEGSRTDVRNVRRAVAWMRDAFAAAAHRHRRHALARLVLIDVSKVRDRAGASAAAQSLEDFAMERDLEDFSMEDQLAYYQEAYGKGTQREKRGARLLRRQLDGIACLEQVASEAPYPDDGVRAWLTLTMHRYTCSAWPSIYRNVRLGPPRRQSIRAAALTPSPCRISSRCSLPNAQTILTMSHRSRRHNCAVQARTGYATPESHIPLPPAHRPRSK